MKKFFVFVAFLALTTSHAIAGLIGPYYLATVGYCNVREMYVDLSSNVGFGREVGCASSWGYTFVGHLDWTANSFTIVRNTPGAVPGMNSEMTLGVYGMNDNWLDIYSANSNGILFNNLGLRYTITTFMPVSQASKGSGKELPDHDMPK